MTNPQIQDAHQPHHPPQNPSAHDAHVNHLKQMLGTLINPKRPAMSRSHSGSASPAAAWGAHAHHDAPRSGAGTPTLGGVSIPHHPVITPASDPPSPSAHHLHIDTAPTTPTDTESTPQHKITVTNHTSRSATVPVPHGPDGSTPSPSSVTVPPHSRTTFITTLQSKRAWEALIHGTMV